MGIRLLLIGEAPPASGRNFFKQDSGLYRAIFEVFQGVDGGITHEAFPRVFSGCGCGLVDLCERPVDQLDEKARRIARTEAEPVLARRLAEMRPEAIITMLRAIAPNVHRATAAAGWTGRHTVLPYPGRWVRHREVFVRELRPWIEELLLPASGSGPKAGGESG
jgi:hypothetical protein